jgi:hypothetical protein
MNLRTEMTKAPGGADAFSVIESALLQASLDANAEIARGWPAGKTPAQARFWRKLMALKRKRVRSMRHWSHSTGCGSPQVWFRRWPTYRSSP